MGSQAISALNQRNFFNIPAIFILILSTHLCLIFRSRLFPSHFHVKVKINFCLLENYYAWGGKPQSWQNVSRPRSEPRTPLVRSRNDNRPISGLWC